MGGAVCSSCSSNSTHAEDGIPSPPKAAARVTTFAEEDVVLETEGEGDGEWTRLGGEVLEPALRTELVKLLDAQWLVSCAASGGTLVRRQELPERAFTSLAALKSAGRGTGYNRRWEWLRVICLSCPWLQPGHPDAHGENLRLVAKVLKVFVEDEENEGKPYGILIDFASLPQAPRTEVEEELFKRALESLSLFYAHPQTVVLKVTQLPEGYPHESTPIYVLPQHANTKPYEERGWCFAEAAMSSLVKDSRKVLDLGQLDRADPEMNLVDMKLKCGAQRKPPLQPQAFRQALATKSFTSRESDFEQVAELYSAAFQRHFSTAEQMSYAQLGWGADELRRLLEAGITSVTSLNLAQNELRDEGARVLAKSMTSLPVLRFLDLRSNRVGASGAAALAAALSSSALQRLNLDRNRVGTAGAEALATALRPNHTLQELSLHDNVVGNAGVAAIADALKLNDALRSLWLRWNEVGPAGVAALAEALRVNSTLRSLDLGWNGMGVLGAASLAEALKANPALQALDLRGNAVGDAGAAALADALKSNSCLKELSVERNSLGEQGTQALRAAASMRSARGAEELAIEF